VVKNTKKTMTYSYQSTIKIRLFVSLQPYERDNSMNNMTPKRVIGIGETVLDILFKNDQPQKAVPGGSTFNSIVSLGRQACPAPC